MPPKKTNQKASLQDLLANLTVHVTNEEHDSVVAVADKVLAQNPSDSKARKAKIIALVKVDRYAEALAELEKSPEEKGLELEKAYSLYRLGKLEDANAAIDKAVAGEVGGAALRGLKHLKAQIAYRQDKFAEAKAIYDDLSSGPYMVGGEDHDVLVNSLAIQTQQRWWNEDVEPTPAMSASSHEHAYNLATLKISEQKYDEALKLLAQAKEMAQSVDGLSESELQDELYPILIQAAYVHILQGDSTAASEILSGLEITSATEPLVRDLVIQNSLALGTDATYNLSNPHVTLRQLDSVQQTAASKSAYIKFQRKLISQNRLSVEYLAGKESAVKRGIKRHLEEFPEDEGVRMLTFQPALLDPFATGGKYSSKNVLGRALKRFAKDKSNVALGIAIVQLLLEQKKIDHAAEILEQMQKSGVPRYPGLVAVEHEVFELQGRRAKSVVVV
ncbi:hypothetical protein BZA70DRAFT_271202 [Myxozyma melibiosi]|uniref:Signal recognition particle subunit SRP72 n=1 Tax=Myxozyma melibiosi TaxID=54550 RepID=A0ABR1FCC2_9ASCO